MHTEVTYLNKFYVVFKATLKNLRNRVHTKDTKAKSSKANNICKGYRYN
jgi:hypothetical protein